MTKSDDFYREGDNAFQAAGGLEGLRKLVNDFYDLMDSLPEAQIIRDMHRDDTSELREKLTLFLCGYFNGPDLFEQKYGPFRLGAFHHQFPIGAEERDAWLFCMKKALDMQPYPESFKEHALARLMTPAERCRTR